MRSDLGERKKIHKNQQIAAHTTDDDLCTGPTAGRIEHTRMIEKFSSQFAHFEIEKLRSSEEKIYR